MRKRTLCNPNQPTEEIQPEQIGNFCDVDILEIIGDDKSLITYRPKLNQITGSVTATILLQQIIYWWGKNEREPFYKFKEPCSHSLYHSGDSWCEELGFTRKEFDSALKKIADKTTKNEQHKEKTIQYWTTRDRVTFFKVNEQVLAKVLKVLYQKAERCFTKRPKGTLDIPYKKTTQETTQETLSLTDKKPSIRERNEKHLPLAEYLALIIHSSKNITFTRKQINTWANEIRQLVETNEVNPARIQKALDWYQIHVGDQYVPVIESGASLHSKFIKLEAAMERNQMSSRGSKRLGAAQSDDAPYPVDCIVEE